MHSGGSSSTQLSAIDNSTSPCTSPPSHAHPPRNWARNLTITRLCMPEMIDNLPKTDRDLLHVIFWLGYGAALAA